MIIHIDEAGENRKIALGTFLDIEGASDSISFDIITKAAKRHGLEDMICRWIGSMLRSKKITATLARETLEESVTRGCPQGGILSPLLWSLVVDEPIRGLNGYYTLGYADDIAVLIHGKFFNTISELLQEALNMVQQ
jgi:retron-type reverse transcriptase